MEVILDVDDTDVVGDTPALTDDDWSFNTDSLENGKVARLKDPESAINHSCDPISCVKTISQGRRVVAMKRIVIGEEITAGYAINGYNDGKFECLCGSTDCRRVYQGNLLKLPRNARIRYLPYLEERFKKEHEPEVRPLSTAAASQ